MSYFFPSIRSSESLVWYMSGRELRGVPFGYLRWMLDSGMFRDGQNQALGVAVSREHERRVTDDWTMVLTDGGEWIPIDQCDSSVR